MIEGIEHICIIVPHIEKAIEEFCASYKLPHPEIRDVKHRNMKVSVLKFGNCEVEFVEDYDKQTELSKKVAREGSFIHHFALKTTDFSNDIKKLKETGCTMADSEPAVGLRGKKVLFFNDKATGLSLELTE